MQILLEDNCSEKKREKLLCYQKRMRLGFLTYMPNQHCPCDPVTRLGCYCCIIASSFESIGYAVEFLFRKLAAIELKLYQIP